MWVSFWKQKTLIKGVKCPTVNWTSRKKIQQTFSTYNYLDQSVCSVTSVVSNSLWPQWTVAHQAPLSMGFSRQEYWGGLPFPPPEDLPNLGIKPGSPTLQADTLPSEPLGKSNYLNIQNVPCGSTGKESTCSAGDLGLIPGLGQMPWRRERLQYSGLEKSMDCVVHGFS